ncbi:Protein-lysine N-methyltransferase EFM4 [Rhizoctonia solani]|uniref:Protein-lysine N-methyltransferase EFM4 n=1 Tax=Rhizoctonia solani TaxID=456999 RepID=A0A8H7H903_9AGAM|nr:Protein-lysine N-methyltransferase EFM4 [Rhizoctonia solani]
MLSSSDIVANKTKSSFAIRTYAYLITMVSQGPIRNLSHPPCWDDVYNNEVENFETNGDEGEVWFGEETVEKMLEWTLDNYPPNTEPYVLDIGTGNGIMTVTLAENGYDPGHLVGLDYSEPSVKLARAVANARGHSSIRYVVSDFINETAPAPTEGVSPGNWDLLQGTYDAIALSGRSEDGKTIVSRYPPKVAEALKPGGMFLITSCNFTEEELKEAFGAPELGLTYHSRIQHPTFTFGGKSGSVCASVAFKKN